MNSEKQSTNLQMTLREVNRVGEVKKNIPKLRFKGYEDAWEQRKLGEVFEQTVEYVNPKLENIELWSVTVESGLTPKTERYNREALVKKEDKFKLVHPGDIVYNPMNMTIGAVGMNQHSNSIAVSGYYVTMRLRENFNVFYFFEWLSSDRAMNLFRNHATGSLIEKQRVQFPTLSNINAYVPEFIEQKNIGRFFQRLDNLITLHQRKYDALKSMKKTLLSKMFPKNGEDVPEIRFKGFTDAWEQRSFKEITFLSGKKNKDNLALESYSITNEEGFVPQNEHFENGGTMKDADKSMYIIVSANSFAYNPARINVGSIGYKADGEDVIVSSLYEVFKTIEDIDDNFLWHWFKSPHLQRLIMKFQEGGVRLYFYYNKLCLGYISVPEYREQNKISQTLGTLDNLITLHQRKLDELKNMKKTLLQQMFV